MNKRPIMIRAGHASRATRYRNQARQLMERASALRSEASALAKEARLLEEKATEQDRAAESISIAV